MVNTLFPLNPQWMLNLSMYSSQAVSLLWYFQILPWIKQSYAGISWSICCWWDQARTSQSFQGKIFYLWKFWNRKLLSFTFVSLIFSISFSMEMLDFFSPTCQKKKLKGNFCICHFVYDVLFLYGRDIIVAVLLLAFRQS